MMTVQQIGYSVWQKLFHDHIIRTVDEYQRILQYIDDNLTQMTDIRSDYSQSEDRPYYFQVVDGKNHYISMQEFFELSTIYDNPPTIMKMAFIPIAY